MTKAIPAIPRRQITSDQQEVLEFIAQCRDQYLTPTMEAICENVHRCRETGFRQRQAHIAQCLRALEKKGFVNLDDDAIEIVGDTENILLATRLRAALAKYGRHGRTCAVSRYAHRVDCDCGLDDAKRL